VTEALRPRKKRCVTMVVACTGEVSTRRVCGAATGCRRFSILSTILLAASSVSSDSGEGEKELATVWYSTSGGEAVGGLEVWELCEEPSTKSIKSRKS
jgi:hypothetical protein